MFDIIAFTSISFAGIVSIIHAIQSSKCDTIDLCCFKCHRQVKNPNLGEEVEVETLAPAVSPRSVVALNNI